VNVLVLAAGPPPADSKDAYPVWLGEVGDSLVLERQARQLAFSPKTHFVFAFRQQDIETYHLSDIVEQIAAGSSVVTIKRPTQGAACTALLTINEVELENELIIVSATDQIDVDYAAAVESFRARGADAGVMTFESLHPRYSYVRLGNDGWVIEVAEKRPISRTANAGFYWFKRAADFFECAQEMILKDVQVQERFFIAPTLNEMILKQKKIATFPLEANQYHPVKAASQVEAYEHALEKAAR
jgi:dTDP-glucose pyrophosphorylase